MKKFVTWIVIICALVGLGFMYKQSSSDGIDNTIKFIQSHYSSRGTLNDLQNDLGISSINDFKWYDLGKNIEIEYGKVKLKVKKETLDTQEIKDKLARVYITYKYNKEKDKWTFYYQGKEFSKYVK